MMRKHAQKVCHMVTYVCTSDAFFFSAKLGEKIFWSDFFYCIIIITYFLGKKWCVCRLSILMLLSLLLLLDTSVKINIWIIKFCIKLFPVDFSSTKHLLDLIGEVTYFLMMFIGWKKMTFVEWFFYQVHVEVMQNFSPKMTILSWWFRPGNGDKSSLSMTLNF